MGRGIDSFNPAGAVLRKGVMKLKINGEEREFEGSITVERLLNTLDIETRGTAVELNREVVPKSRQGETILNEGDSVEIIRMTGGG